LGAILGDGYQVVASMGHVRDLPGSELGVNIEEAFKPRYRILPEKRPVVASLQKAVSKAETVYLASDPDREGEAIAWHLSHALKLEDPRRLELYELTPQGVERALQQPRSINFNLVNAQQARRILDRLVGYSLSPLLWRKLLRTNLSAGRVQTVALRILCEREREVEAFVPQEYWNIHGLFVPYEAYGAGDEVWAKLVLETRSGRKFRIESAAQADSIIFEIHAADFRVGAWSQRIREIAPPPPFITSTLQQDASTRLGLSPRQTMRIAQQLYEGLELGRDGHVGLITYMRTDSPRVADVAKKEAHAFIESSFGARYLGPRGREYKAMKGAQEAHEAIRPTSVNRTPERVAQYLNREQLLVYELIWRRFLASQMSPAKVETTTADILANEYLLRASCTRIVFTGYCEAYPPVGGIGSLEEGSEAVKRLREGQRLRALDLCRELRFTEPPPRYTEASLIRALEKHGIGRPSTYAPTVSTLLDRGYVERVRRVLHPTKLGFQVLDELLPRFPDILDVGFTARMEEQLDSIEEGKQDWVEVLRGFYGPFRDALTGATETTCPECGRPMELKFGRWGPYLACSGQPDCKKTMPLVGSEPVEEKCEVCSRPLVMRGSRYGPFLSCSGFPECRYKRPLSVREAEPQGQPEENAEGEGTSSGGQDDAAKAVGEVCPECGKPLVKRVSRYGPFLGCSGYPECRYIKSSRRRRRGAKARRAVS
jgi:DNA topoisomerase-1